jgi:hypothetical protein
MFYNGDIKKAMGGYSGAVVMHKFIKEWRPLIEEVFQEFPQLGCVIEKCWVHNPEERPTFHEVLDLLSMAVPKPKSP